VHPELKHALGVFLYAGAYILSPFMVIFGAMSGEMGGYLLSALALLALCGGHVLATQPAAPTSPGETLMEVLFWYCVSAALVLLVAFLTGRPGFLLAIAVASAGLAVWVWFKSSGRTRARISRLPFPA
jgi:hypothetical protein